MSRQPDITQIVIANIERYKTLNYIDTTKIYDAITPSTYSRRMNRRGGRTFDLNELSRIARVLKVTVADLVTK